MKRIGTAFFALLTIALLPGASLQRWTPQPVEPTLKDAYKNYFPMGVAVGPRNLVGPEADLIRQQFNSLTPENAMKMGPIHPEENRYYWNDADAIVDFARQNNLKIRGHNLCWHQQTPNWLFTDAGGKTVSKTVLLKRLKDHITEVVTRYKGKIYQWDVVNEAIDDNNQKFLRESPWSQICGEDFIASAFIYAHEADPNAQLFYNDYNTEQPGKRDRIYTLLKKLIDANVPIHGVGLQGHWSLTEPTETALRDAIDKFSSLGLKVQITELDISVHPSGPNRTDKRPDESNAFTPDMEQKQREQYRKVFAVFREKRKQLTGVTFWNVSDKHSWLDDFPIRGRKNYPLLFDANLKPKKAFYEVVVF